MESIPSPPHIVLWWARQRPNHNMFLDPQCSFWDYASEHNSRTRKPNLMKFCTAIGRCTFATPSKFQRNRFRNAKVISSNISFGSFIIFSFFFFFFFSFSSFSTAYLFRTSTDFAEIFRIAPVCHWVQFRQPIIFSIISYFKSYSEFRVFPF